MLKFLFILLSAFHLVSCSAGSSADDRVRVATFNIAMGLETEGGMAAALRSGTDDRLAAVADIIRRVQPDILLLNEFDYDPEVDAAGLFNANYLGEENAYAYHFRAEVNTGVDSGFDLNADGETGGPADAWGFGHFAGQYGMMILSRYPIRHDLSRTFSRFPWNSLPGALRPVDESGKTVHENNVWEQVRLSSKSHWDVVIEIDGETLHLLAHHPTPPVFDGPEDYNGKRNFDEIRFWREYTDPAGADFIVDDGGQAGGIEKGARFVIAGDFNSDPFDGDSRKGAVAQLLDADWIDGSCTPFSKGAEAASVLQGGVNGDHMGNPAADTADFNDRYAGNLRLDYVLPSTGLNVSGCGVFWPVPGEEGHVRVSVSDHRLVWLDISL